MTAGVLPGLVTTPHGLVALVVDDTVDRAMNAASSCRYVTVTDARAGELTTTEPEPCDGSMAVLGYDPAAEAVLVCGFGVAQARLLQARDAATFETRWALTGADVGIVNPGASFEPVYLGGDTWYCDGVAIDHQAGEMIVPFRAYWGERNRIAAVALSDGTVRWQTSVTPGDTEVTGAVSARTMLEAASH